MNLNKPNDRITVVGGESTGNEADLVCSNPLDSTASVAVETSQVWDRDDCQRLLRAKELIALSAFVPCLGGTTNAPAT